MKIRSSPFSTLVAVAIYVLSVSIAQSDVEKRGSEVRLYENWENSTRVGLKW